LKLIVDECLAESTKEILKEKEFELLEIEEILKQSTSDEEIFDFATEKSLAIITHDKGFGEIHHSANKKPPLIIILEILSPHPRETNNLLQKSLAIINIQDSKYQGKLIIITSAAIRIRPKD